MVRKIKKFEYIIERNARKAAMTSEDIIDSKNEEIARLKNLIKRTQKEIKEILDQECLPSERVISRLYAMLEI